MLVFEPELSDSRPEEFTLLDDGSYVQRIDIHYVEYHSLDGSQTFKGYECLSRVISKEEYEKIKEENSK